MIWMRNLDSTENKSEKHACLLLFFIRRLGATVYDTVIGVFDSFLLGLSKDLACRQTSQLIS